MRRLVLLCAVVGLFASPASAGRLPVLAARDWWPVYSPDGTHVAFTRVNGQGRVFTLYTLDLARRRVVKIAAAAGQLSPTWSSDGRIAWSSGGVLNQANADGSARTRYVAPTPSFGPAWRPHAAELAYLTHHGAQNLDLWVGPSLWAKDVIGTPAWSADGSQLAFDRDDGVYVTTGPGAEHRVVAVDNHGGLAWSSDGRLAFLAMGRLYVAPHSLKVEHVPVNALTPSWSEQADRVSADRAWSPVADDAWVTAGPKPGCPGHTVLLLNGKSPLTGSCTIAGTPGADVIYGTSLWGDVISGGAGNDRIHANDGHTDHVSCGPGRDTVWADKADTLVGCEVVYR